MAYGLWGITIFYWSLCPVVRPGKNNQHLIETKLLKASIKLKTN